MKSYARIASGVVAEIVSLPDDVPIGEAFHEGLVFVDVTAAAPQPEQGWTFDGQAFAAPAAPTLTPGHILAEKLAAGIAIVSTGTSALDGTYALDAESQGQIAALASAAAAGLGFPEDAATLAYPDAAGAPHEFTEVAFVAFYKAVRDYVFRLNTAATLLRAGQAAEWPAQPVTIA